MVSDKEKNLLNRAVTISLFTWRLSEVSDQSENRYGWWGDSFPTVANDKIGSRLYLLRRQKITQQVINNAYDYAVEALKWMVDDAVVLNVDVQVERFQLDGLAMKVTLTLKDGSNFNINYDDFWSLLNGV